MRRCCLAPLVLALIVLLLPAAAPDARAAHRLCDPGLEVCRAILVDL